MPLSDSPGILQLKRSLDRRSPITPSACAVVAAKFESVEHLPPDDSSSIRPTSPAPQVLLIFETDQTVQPAMPVFLAAPAQPDTCELCNEVSALLARCRASAMDPASGLSRSHKRDGELKTDV